MGKLINVIREKYAIIPSDVFTDKRLDYRSKGILCTLLSLPNGWDFSVRALVYLVTPKEEQNLKGEGDNAIRATIHKLEALGYLKRCQSRDDSGKITSWDYKINIPPEV